MRNIKSALCSLGLGIAFVMVGCQQKGPQEDQHLSDSLKLRQQIPASPVLDAKASMQQMQVEKGMEVQLVAAEPQIAVPVAMTFDEKGRMWVVEMHGYMPDTVGTGEDIPNGKIIILEDTNGDGIPDNRKVFMDSLVLPRAICLIENGVLIAEPPKLWFVENNQDVAGKRTLVDDKYTEGGNVEHQPNGLLRAMDNWIYNAKSDKRYRKQGNKWLKEETHFRGQWGISQDNYGRLFYNNNSENLLGDFFSPGLASQNPAQRNVAGYNENIVPNNKVFPIRTNTGVNRGYMKGTLDDSLRLANFTAACGPLVYRGTLLGEAYQGNAFVAEPSANLIKRNILSDSGYIVKGHQAYNDHEFLASKDERFRPVNLHEGPDGALYILDMYRGIIQHKTYLTPYLKAEIKSRSLTDPLNCGRIYRIVPEGTVVKPVSISLQPDSLLALLDHPNGWMRDKAQQLIIDRHLVQLAPALLHRLQETTKPLGLMHALWTLEGLQCLQYKEVAPLLRQGNPYIKAQVLTALPAILHPGNIATAVADLTSAVPDVFLAPYIAYLLPTIKKLDKSAAEKLQLQLMKSYANDKYVADGIINNAANQETQLLKQITDWNPDTTLILRRRLEKVIKDIDSRKKSRLDDALAKEFPRGHLIFKTVCQTCHGADGGGIQSLAPPLNQSNWVNGDKNKLISIVLFGLTGPVEVNGKMYKSPEINGDMPGIGSNDEFSDADIAQVISFIRSSWSNKASKVSAADIIKIRQQYKGRQKTFTEAELK
jgi:putative membrane-bound dehydrogenase-like protein